MFLLYSLYVHCIIWSSFYKKMFGAVCAPCFRPTTLDLICWWVALSSPAAPTRKRIYAAAWYWMAFHLVGKLTLAYDTVVCCCWGCGFSAGDDAMCESLSDTARVCRSKAGKMALVIAWRRDMLGVVSMGGAWCFCCVRKFILVKLNCVVSSECFLFTRSYYCISFVVTQQLLRLLPETAETSQAELLGNWIEKYWIHSVLYIFK